MNRHTMAGCGGRLLRMAAAFFAVASIPARGGTVDFEQAEGFEAGASLGRSAVWEATAATGARIDSVFAASGSQSLRIDPSEGAVVFRSPDFPAGFVRFIDLQIRPIASDATAAQSSLHVFGSDIGFVKAADGRIQLVAADGEGELPKARFLATGAGYGDAGASERWLRLTIRQDLNRGKWDLFIDGELAAFDLVLDQAAPTGESAAGQSGALTIYADASAPVHVDALSIGSVNPLFTDADSDGMPDAFEAAHGFDPSCDDRLGDKNLNGTPNVAEFMLDPSEGGGGPGRRVVYVDNAKGSNAFDGLRSYAAGRSGPKASIQAAMNAAEDGTLIMILPGNRIYQEGSRGAPGKRITIQALETITIR